MYDCVFRRALMYRAETWHGGGVGDGPTRFESIIVFNVTSSKVIERSSCFWTWMSYSHTKFGMKNPWPKCSAMMELRFTQGSARVNQGSNCLGMLCSNQISRKNPWSKWSAMMGVEGHAGVSWGQPGVKLLRNVVWQQNGRKNPVDQSVVQR